MPEKTESQPRILLQLWLALFLLLGLQDLRSIISHQSGLPWLGYVVVGVLIGVELLIIASKTITGLRAIRLTIYTGCLLIAFNHLLDLLYGINWHSLGDRVVLGYGWNEFWYSPDWVRIITYISLGYMVVYRKGLLRGIFTNILVALADSTLSWLVLALFMTRIGLSGVWEDYQLLGSEILRVLVIEASILALLGLIGAIVAWIRWPLLSLPTSDGTTT